MNTHFRLTENEIFISSEGDLIPEFYFFVPRSPEQGGVLSILEEIHQLLGPKTGVLPDWAFDLQVTFWDKFNTTEEATILESEVRDYFSSESSPFIMTTENAQLVSTSKELKEKTLETTTFVSGSCFELLCDFTNTESIQLAKNLQFDYYPMVFLQDLFISTSNIGITMRVKREQDAQSFLGEM